MKKLTLVLMVALMATACCNCRNSSPKAHAPLDVTVWQLQQMNGRNVAAMLQEGEQAQTLVLSKDGSYGGYGGCNSYGGEFKITPSEVEHQKDIVGKIDFGAMYSTKRFCGHHNNEDEFFKTLDGVDSYVIDGEMLYLFTAGDLTMVFTPQKK